MKYDIFVSYRRSDRELVASIVRRLEARGLAVWYDAEIEGESDWREVIVEALTDSSMLVIFFSEDANNSRQLKKELAVADSLGKPVVPILIEDTRPRGAFLYELADRHWIQAFPDPMEKIDELVEHLATLAGKDGLLGTQAPAPGVAANDTGVAITRSTPPPWAAPAAPEAAREAEQPLTEAVEEFVAGERDSAAPPPKAARAYVGRVNEDGKRIRRLNDILPFRWIDLLAIVPAAAVLFLVGAPPDPFSPQHARESGFAIALIFVVVAAGYGALAFPIRYFLRRRPLGGALGNYLISTGILYAVVVGGYALSVAAGISGLDTGQAALRLAVIWGAFTLLAFVVYGMLAGQRAMRSFRSNIRKI